MKKSKPIQFFNETTAHFKALGTLRQTIHLLPPEMRGPMRDLLKQIRKAEVRRRVQFLRAHAECHRLNKEASDEAV